MEGDASGCDLMPVTLVHSTASKRLKLGATPTPARAHVPAAGHYPMQCAFTYGLVSPDCITWVAALEWH
jgi:hypothetical protein